MPLTVCPETNSAGDYVKSTCSDHWVERAQWFDRGVVGIVLESVKPATGMGKWKQIKSGIPVRIGLISELERRGQLEANLYEPIMSGVPAFSKKMTEAGTTAEVTIDHSRSTPVFDSSHASVTQVPPLSVCPQLFALKLT